MPRSNPPGGLTIALAEPSENDGSPASATFRAGPTHTAPLGSNHTPEPADTSPLSVPPSPASPKNLQSRSFFSGHRTPRFGKPRAAPDFPPDRLLSNASSSSTLTGSTPALYHRPNSPSPFSGAEQRQGSVADALSVSDRSGLGSSAASEQDKESDWNPENTLNPDLDNISQRPRPIPSKHVFHQLMSRSRSTNNQQRQMPPRSIPGRRYLEPTLAEGTMMDSPLTAPLEQERNYREMMVNSAPRNRSADRTTLGSKEGSESSFRPGTSWESSGMATQAQRPSNKPTGGLRNMFVRLTRTGSAQEDSDSEPPPLVVDEFYTYRVLTLPLVEQTRLTRIVRRLEDAKDKTEFWLPALAYRCIDYLNYKGVAHEGLYRVPGSSRDIKYWTQRFDKDGDVNLREERHLYDINIVTSMLKNWLRDLPDELLPKSVQAKIQAEGGNVPDVPQVLKDELSKLSPYHYYLLFAISCHIAILHSNNSVNKMNYTNICVCFQPCIKIDAYCFYYLVHDWEACWQGCYVEKDFFKEEGIEIPDPPPSSAGYSLASDDQIFTVDSNSRPATGDVVEPTTSHLRGFSSLPIRDHMQGDSARYENYDNIMHTPSRTAARRSTPPTLSPVAALSPMRL